MYCFACSKIPGSKSHEIDIKCLLVGRIPYVQYSEHDLVHSKLCVDTKFFIR